MDVEKKALGLSETVGARQGWGVFDTLCGLEVQKLDEAAILQNDSAAITLARKAGIDCDDFGRIYGLHADAGAAWPTRHC